MTPNHSHEALKVRESVEAGISQESWSFKLSSSYPRRELPWTPGKALAEVESMRGGGQVVVEAIPGHSLIPGNGQPHDDGSSDEYDTEEE